MTTTINSHVASLAHELHMDILSVSHSTFNFDAKEKVDVDVWRVYVTVVYQSNGQTASGIVEHVKRTWVSHWSAHSLHPNFVELGTWHIRGNV